MTRDPSHRRDGDCCAGVGLRTPRRIANPPGQDEIAWRPGRHADFFASMVARLSSSEHPALAGLTTREPSDLTLALADGLASTLEVLAFYAERQANEQYLRTATEHRSLRELAALIGYRPAPGVAATTHLAFTLQSVPGVAATPIVIPAGTRVRSVPGQDETPQVFETIEAAPARADWNALSPQRNRPRTPASGDTQLWLAGSDTGLEAGDRILIVSAVHEAVPTDDQWAVRVLTSVDANPAAARTKVRWASPLGHGRPFTPGKLVRVFAFRTRTAVFGAAAPDWRALSDDAKASYIGLPDASHLERPGDVEEWPDFSVLAPVYPEQRSGSAAAIETHVAATVDDIVLAATATAQGAATKAMSDAASAGGGVVMAGGELADGALALTKQTVSGVAKVADQATGEVLRRAGSLISAQAHALQALQSSAEQLSWQGAVDAARLAVEGVLAGLPTILQRFAAEGLSDAQEVASKVLELIEESLPDGPPSVIASELQATWEAAKTSIEAQIAETKDDVASSAQWFLGAIDALLQGQDEKEAAAQAALDKLIERLDGLAQSAPAGETAETVARDFIGALKDAIGTQLDPAHFADLLNVTGAVDTVQDLTQAMFSAGGEVGRTLMTMHRLIAGAAATVFARLEHQIAGVAAEARSTVAGTAELLNPANAVHALGESAAALRDHARSAAAAALGAAAAADVAGLVTFAVNIARKRDINPLLDPPTPESVAAAARHFAAVGVARAGGTVPAGAAPGQAPALIEAIHAMLPAAAPEGTGVANQLLSLMGDAHDLLAAPGEAAQQAYYAISSEIDRALAGRIVTLPGRRAPLVRALDTIDISPKKDGIVAGRWALLSAPGFVAPLQVTEVGTGSRAEYLMSGQTTRVRLGDAVPAELRQSVRSLVVDIESEPLEFAPEPLASPVYGDEIALDTLATALEPGRALALRGPRQRVCVADGVADLAWVAQDGAVRTLSEGDRLWLMAPPARLLGSGPQALDPETFAALVGSQAVHLRLMLRDRDGATGTVEARASEIVLEAAGDDDDLVAEIAHLAPTDDAVRSGRRRTHLRLAESTVHCYDRHALRINANVALATHGESIEQILGDGDGSATDQRFSLSQGPLTHVPAATPAGSRSTLEVRVGDVAWTEVPTLYAAAAEARRYETRDAENATTVVQFGDGVEGGRLPSGSTNVRARYRKGLGREGNVGAGTLTTLLTRPLGVTDVVNPEAATGGDAPEDEARARENAPLTVLTLDRAVSISDYTHFARTFAGTAKAHALWVPTGPARGVFLTIAGIDGAEVPASSETFTKLAEALHTWGDPLVPLRIVNHTDIRFRLHLLVKVEPAFEHATVLAGVDESLRARFGFAARRFGQAVSVDEVAAVAHTVSGVAAVNVIRLHRVDAVASRQPRIFARLPIASATAEPVPAELLTLADGPIGLEVMP